MSGLEIPIIKLGNKHNNPKDDTPKPVIVIVGRLNPG